MDTVSDTLYHIPNPDGSPRWIWPAGLKQPLFLSFYNRSTWKQHVFHHLITWVFRLGAQTLVFRKWRNEIPLHLPRHSNWSLFTGTVGPNNKWIICEQPNPSYRSFTKIALSNRAYKLIHNEHKALKKLDRCRSNFSFSWPRVLNFKASRLELQGLSPYRHASVWGEAHNGFLKETQEMGSEEKSTVAWSQWKWIQERLDHLEAVIDTRIPKSLLDKLYQLFSEVDHRQQVHFHFSHGDFTPWNCFMTSDDSLGIIDWELAREEMPKGTDLFHFILQKGVMQSRISPEKIKQEWVKYGVQSGLFDCAKEMEAYINLYLLHHITSYLSLYQKQKKWHAQIHWQLQTWNRLLNAQIKNLNHRALFIADFFQDIKKLHYAGMKLPASPHHISAHSDLDLIVKRSDATHYISAIKNNPLVAKFSRVKTSSAHRIHIVFKDASRLSIDLLFACIRKSIVFQDARHIIANAHESLWGLKTASPLDTARYIGYFYALNKASVPEAYQHYARELTNTNTADKLLKTYYMGTIDVTSALKSELKRQQKNWPLFRGINTLRYAFDFFRDMRNQKGFVITFSGVDGAGKSTVIRTLAHSLRKQYRKPVIVLRHRPSILPILSAFRYGKKEAEQRSLARLPRTGENRYYLGSILRFAYYFTDYFLGQFYIQFRYVWRGTIVIYDRYYFDMINDAKRTNIHLPRKFLNACYTLLLKPEYNFFLYASPETIRKRKQELTTSTIRQLTHCYLNLFNHLQGHRSSEQYISIRNQYLSQTMDTIIRRIPSL